VHDTVLGPVKDQGEEGQQLQEKESNEPEFCIWHLIHKKHTFQDWQQQQVYRNIEQHQVAVRLG
jgi:hypothetical protein